MDTTNEISLVVSTNTSVIRNKTSQLSAIQHGQAGTADYVPHVTSDQVKLLSLYASHSKRNGERNSLLIKFLFDCCLRVSEALSVCPVDLQRTPDGWTVHVIGKGSKPGVVALSPSLAAELQSYCYRSQVDANERIFPISRSQVFRIVTKAFDNAGIPKPTKDREHVGGVHILRHSGAIERLRVTGNPRATQNQLRHKSALMTLRYLKTISADESLRIQQGIDLW